jgi:2-oxoglutarate decarboxylase
VEPNVFETANAGFAQIMYEEFLRDPAAVSEEWRQYFETGVKGLTPENGSEDHPSVVIALPAGPVEKAETSMPAPSSVTPAPPAPPAAPAPTGAVPITGPAARLVANMNESRSLPTATSFRELPVATLDARRRELNNALRAAGRTEKISFTHLIGYAVARAAARHPALTAVYTEIGGAVRSTSASRWTSSARTAAGASWFR